MLGLVMTGGGARGAFQAGVLKRIGELPRFKKNTPTPFKILAGASAGAINVTALASISKDFPQTTRLISMLWSRLQISDVYRTDLSSLGSKAARWMKDLALGGMIGGGSADSLLDATPLHHFLSKNLPIQGISESIASEHLYAIAISATNYYNGYSFTFVQGKKGHPTWKKSRKICLPTQLTVDHVCASAAIPIVFQPVLLETDYGAFYFGDGCLRLYAPLNPAIRLGAKKIIAIGVKSKNQELADAHKDPNAKQKPSMAQMIGVSLNAIFLDHLDTDIEHLDRINSLIEGYEKAGAHAGTLDEPMKRISALSITPSMDLGILAHEHSSQLPSTVRYFMEGLGSVGSDCVDLISYLLFDSGYTRALIDLGYQDAHARIDEIEEFIS